jgi:UTP--glucose-1-phosphate uridylyltransferase
MYNGALRWGSCLGLRRDRQLPKGEQRMPILKAVITAAGWGTRFLPAAKSQPKEMIPLVDKPVIQYAVEEAVASGIHQIIIVTAQGKHAIEDYFDRSFELEHYLEQKGELKLLDEVRHVSQMANICYIRQKEQLGLGHAVLTAKDLVGDEPFAVFLPDDLFHSQVPVMKQMLEIYQRYPGNIIATQHVEEEDIEKYGIIEPKKLDERVYQVLNLVEKPRPEEAPSRLGITGRYILMPQIFEALEATPPGKGQEIQLTDGLRLLLQSQAVYAYEFEGIRYDTGTPLGWLKATVAMALQHAQLGPQFKDYLKSIKV